MNTRAYSRPSVSRTFTYKKVTKPMLERRRRARISKCLEELRSIIEVPFKLTEEGSSRLEKADILELSVRHLQKLISTRSRNRFQEGFDECAAEACHFLEKQPDVDNTLAERVVEHLETCTGPLSIQVPQYKLSFTTEQPQRTREDQFLLDTPVSDNSTGLLMQTTHTNQGSPNFTKIGHNSADFVYRNRSMSESRLTLSERNMWRPW